MARKNLEKGGKRPHKTSLQLAKDLCAVEIPCDSDKKERVIRAFENELIRFKELRDCGEPLTHDEQMQEYGRITIEQDLQRVSAALSAYVKGQSTPTVLADLQLLPGVIQAIIRKMQVMMNEQKGTADNAHDVMRAFRDALLKDDETQDKYIAGGDHLNPDSGDNVAEFKKKHMQQFWQDKKSKTGWEQALEIAQSLVASLDIGKNGPRR